MIIYSFRKYYAAIKVFLKYLNTVLIIPLNCFIFFLIHYYNHFIIINFIILKFCFHLIIILINNLNEYFPILIFTFNFLAYLFIHLI